MKKYICLISLVISLSGCMYGPPPSMSQYINGPQDLKNPQIIALAQNYLQVLGYYGDQVDGIFGKNSRRAVRNFEKDNLLPVDGRLDKAVIVLLENQVNSRSGQMQYSANSGIQNSYSANQYQGSSAGFSRSGFGLNTEGILRADQAARDFQGATGGIITAADRLGLPVHGLRSFHDSATTLRSLTGAASGVSNSIDSFNAINNYASPAAQSRINNRMRNYQQAETEAQAKYDYLNNQRNLKQILRNNPPRAYWPQAYTGYPGSRYPNVSNYHPVWTMGR